MVIRGRSPPAAAHLPGSQGEHVRVQRHSVPSDHSAILLRGGAPSFGDVPLLGRFIGGPSGVDWRQPAESAEADFGKPLGPAHGILLGLALGALLWVLIGGAIWRLLLSH